MRKLLVLFSILFITSIGSAQKNAWTGGITGDLKSNFISPITYGGFSTGIFAEYQLTNRVHINTALKYNYLTDNGIYIAECGLDLYREDIDFFIMDTYYRTNILQLPVNFLINIIQSKNQHFKLLLTGGAGPAYILDYSKIYSGAEDIYSVKYNKGIHFLAHGGIEARFKLCNNYYLGLGSEATSFGAYYKTTESPFAATVKIGRALK